MRICFIAPSGYGKTTAVNYLEKVYNAKNIKIADFLYEVQEYIYRRMGIDTRGRQDGELLQFLGTKIRKIDPLFLLNDFRNKVEVSANEVILNDDCRPLDYDELKRLGFIFVGIEGLYRGRDDITALNHKLPIEWQNMPPCDYTIRNYLGLEEYYRELENLMEAIKNDKQVLRYTNSESM